MLILAVTFVRSSSRIRYSVFRTAFRSTRKTLPRCRPSGVQHRGQLRQQRRLGALRRRDADDYFSQIVALVFHQFLSVAMGMSVAIVVIRAIARRTMSTLGNFWVDWRRDFVHPGADHAVLASALVANGAIQNFSNYSLVHTLTNGVQTIAQVRFASMEAIKDLGATAGGSSTPTLPIHSRIRTGHQRARDLQLPADSLRADHYLRSLGGQGEAGNRARLGHGIILISAFGVVAWQEQQGNPALVTTGASQVSTSTSAGGNMEGKEARFGPIQSALYNTAHRNQHGLRRRLDG